MPTSSKKGGKLDKGKANFSVNIVSSVDDNREKPSYPTEKHQKSLEIGIDCELD
jgi:hypothetical protein